jgi:amino acid transporter
VVIAFIGYIVGAIALTVYNYIWKILEEPNTPWDQKYTMTMLMSIILSIISAMFFFSNVQVPVGLASDFSIFIITFAEGFAVNHVINKPISYLAKRGEQNEPPKPPTP